jgi:hypothetical protein
MIAPIVREKGPIAPEDPDYRDMRQQKEHRVSVIKDSCHERLGLTEHWDPPDMMLYNALKAHSAKKPEFKARVQMGEKRQNLILTKIFSGQLTPEEELGIVMST